MKIFGIFLIFIVMRMGLTIHLDDGCEVKSEWKVDYKWTEIYLSAWVPPGKASKILTIEVDFEDHILPLTYDSIEIYRNEIVLRRYREGEISSVINQTSLSVPEGWANLIFTLDSHYELRYQQNNTVLPLSEKVDYLPQYFVIKGSNVTLNCKSGKRVWRSAGDVVELPLPKAEKHWITLYSTKQFLPKLVLEFREIPIGYSEGELTTIPTRIRPLPALEEHPLAISCQCESECMCILEVGESMKVVEDIRLNNIPESVSFEVTQGFSYVILHDNNPLSLQIAVNSTNRTSVDEDLDASQLPMVPFCVITAIVSMILSTVIMSLGAWNRSIKEILKLKPSASEITHVESSEAASPMQYAELQKMYSLPQEISPSDSLISKSSGISEGTVTSHSETS